MTNQDRSTLVAALAELLALLKLRHYRFTTITPDSHARVLARCPAATATTLRDMLGWSLPFTLGSIDTEVEDILKNNRLLMEHASQFRAAIRVSSLHEQLFVHSAFPTDRSDAVFFGPDSYRYARLIRQQLNRCPPAKAPHIVDIGTGSGVGGIVAALARPDAALSCTDLNPTALLYATANARAAGVAIRLVEGPTLDALDRPVDVAFANPPFIMDSTGRSYRDGGALHGGKVALDMARMAALRLAPGGVVSIYTGASIVAGKNPLCEALDDLAMEHGLVFTCEELDPDVFGEELSNAAYADVERIAVIAATLSRA